MNPLDDVPSEKAFRFCNGTVAVNLYQLADTIQHTDEGVFLYHVSSDRNDFANWILHVFEDEHLYELIKNERSKYWFVKKLRYHLEQLEKE